MASTDIDRLSIDTIRTLSMDGVQAANSGHPGLPMAMAPVAYLLFARVMEHNPADPSWPDRDRFILSAGHGSMLLYSVLHLSGYDLPLDELKHFRQWGSLTPGHPERDRVHVTPGVEITTGPLGQGFANGVGMAMAEHFLRAHFGAEVQNHRVFAIVSDGDLMEGIAAEAASLAGKLGLGRIVYLYDDNDISLDGPTELSFDTEDVAKRFEAYRWHVQTVDDANDLGALEVAIDQAMREEERPSLIRVKSIIGWPSPNKQGTSKAHGSPLGEDEVRLTKEILGWDPDQHFVVPDEVREHFDQRARGAALQAEWEQRYRAWRDGPRRARRPLGRRVGGQAAARRARGAREHRLGEGQARHALGRPEGDGRLLGLRADDGRRRRRPQRVDQDRVPRRPRAQLQAGPPGAQRLLRRARARHGRRRSTAWPATAGSCAPTARPSCSSPTTCAARSACRR